MCDREFTREAIAIVVDRSINADHVVATLDRHAVQRGRPPAFARFDNGPEFVAHAVADWSRFNQVGNCFINPGSPLQNAWIESFNGRLRDEFLNGWQFDSLAEARILIEDRRIDYNTKGLTARSGCSPRPSSTTSGRPPTNHQPHSHWTTYRGPLKTALINSATHH